MTSQTCVVAAAHYQNHQCGIANVTESFDPMWHGGGDGSCSQGYAEIQRLLKSKCLLCNCCRYRQSYVIMQWRFTPIFQILGSIKAQLKPYGICCSSPCWGMWSHLGKHPVHENIPSKLCCLLPVFEDPSPLEVVDNHEDYPYGNKRFFFK